MSDTLYFVFGFAAAALALAVIGLGLWRALRSESEDLRRLQTPTALIAGAWAALIAALLFMGDMNMSSTQAFENGALTLGIGLVTVFVSWVLLDMVIESKKRKSSDTEDDQDLAS